MSVIGWSEIVAVLIGAIAAGALQTIIAMVDRKKQSEAVLTAIASEVDAICRLIQHQQYFEAVSEIAEDVAKGMWNGKSYVIDIRSNYFAVFEGLVGELGHLRPHECRKIVNFYAYCRSVIDSTRPDGPHASDPNSVESAANMVSVAALLKSIINLGTEIVGMPKLDLLDDPSKIESP